MAYLYVYISIPETYQKQPYTTRPTYMYGVPNNCSLKPIGRPW